MSWMTPNEVRIALGLKPIIDPEAEKEADKLVKKGEVNEQTKSGEPEGVSVSAEDG